MVIYDDFLGWMLIYDALIIGIWRISARFWEIIGGHEPEKKEGRAQTEHLPTSKHVLGVPCLVFGMIYQFGVEQQVSNITNLNARDTRRPWENDANFFANRRIEEWKPI